MFYGYAVLTMVTGIFLSLPHAAAQTKKGIPLIGNGTRVSFEYNLSDEQGRLIESNKGKQPLTYTHGKGEIIPGLEKQLAGMRVNDQKIIRVKAEEAYGHVNPKAFKEVPRAQIPADSSKVGAPLFAKTAQGESIPVRVHEIKKDTVVLDFNHPLAGKPLTFDVKVLGIHSPETK